MATRRYPLLKIAVVDPGTPLQEPAASILLPRRKVCYPGYGGVHFPGNMDIWMETQEWDDAKFDMVQFRRNPSPGDPVANMPFPPSGNLPVPDEDDAYLYPAFVPLDTGETHPPLMLTPFMDTRGYERAEAWGDGDKWFDQHIDLNYWEPFGYKTGGSGPSAYNNYWHDYTGPVWLAPVLYFGMGKLPDPEEEGEEPQEYEDDTPLGYYAGLRSRFSLPIDPIICLALWRAQLPTETPLKPFGTYVRFGISEYGYFLLEIPYEGNTRLWWKDTIYTGNSPISLKPNKGQASIGVNDLIQAMQKRDANEEFSLGKLWIVALPGGIYVASGTGVGSNGTYFKYPDRMLSSDWANIAGVRPHVPKGKIMVYHNAGHFAFSFYPIWMPPIKHYYPPVEYLSYPYNLNTNIYVVKPYRAPVYDQDGDEEHYEIVADASGRAFMGDPRSRVPAPIGATPGGRAFEYEITLTSDTYSEQIIGRPKISEKQQAGSVGLVFDFQTCRSPVVYWHKFYQDSAWVEVNEEAKLIEAKDLSMTAATGKIGRMAKVGLDNQLGGWPLEIQDGQRRRIQIAGTWVREDGTEEVLVNMQSGLISSFDAAEHQDIDLDANIIDLIQIAGEEKCEGPAPCFDGELVTGAFAWICQKLGLFYNIEDLSPIVTGNDGIARFNYGQPTELLWSVEAGRSWVEVMKTMATYAGTAGLYVVNGVLWKVCPYCGQPRNGNRNSPDYWWYHTHNGPASGGVITNDDGTTTKRGCIGADVTRSGNSYGVDFFLTVGANDIARIADKTGGEVVAGPAQTMFHEIQDINGPQFRVDQEYYNNVVVRGAKLGNRNEPLGAAYTDYWSIRGTIPYPGAGFPLGYKKTLELTFPWANSQTIVGRIAKALFKKHSFRPEFVSVRIPFSPAACRGKVFCIVGAGVLGMDGKKYRITDVEHKVGPDRGPGSTVLTGQAIGWVIPPE